MKTIYTFTLENDNYSLGKVHNDIRLVAYLLYDTIYNYYGDDKIPLNINEHIEYNQLNEMTRLSSVKNYDNEERYNYMFSSDLYDDKYTDYEPFIIGDNTFGFTICDDEFKTELIQSLIENILTMLKLDYKLNINTVSYQARDINDERCRDNAMNSLYHKLGHKYVKKNTFMSKFASGLGKKSR